MSTDVVLARPVAVPAGVEVDALVRIATNLAAAGIYRKTAQTPEGVFAVLLAARDMGVSATAALAGGIHMVEGKPEVSANLQAQLLREYRGPEGQRYDFRIITPARERTKECHIEFRRFWPGQTVWDQGEVVGDEFFDLEDAKRAGLAGKDNYRKYPKMMLLARCLSDGIASHCPETARGLRVYGESEIGGAPPTPPLHESPRDEEMTDAEVVPSGAATPSTASDVTTPDPWVDAIGPRVRPFLKEMREAITAAGGSVPERVSSWGRVLGSLDRQQREAFEAWLTSREERQGDVPWRSDDDSAADAAVGALAALADGEGDRPTLPEDARPPLEPGSVPMPRIPADLGLQARRGRLAEAGCICADPIQGENPDCPLADHYMPATGAKAA